MGFLVRKICKQVAEIVSELRNERLDLAVRLHGLDQLIYHLVTRENGKFHIYEENMHYVNIDRIKRVKEKKNSVRFEDNFAEYNFNKSKSTLFKRFKTENPILSVDVDILNDPYSFLLNQSGFVQYVVKDTAEALEQIYLPLYSPKTGDVEKASGLNHWNANDSKRPRHYYEVYIPIPSWIHKTFVGFFPYKKGDQESQPFTLILPDKKELSARVCQAGGKALMSNPNKDLGEWLIRHVLKIPDGEVVTNTTLERIGIDSVKVTKLEERKFKIDFSKTHSFEEFKEQFND